MSIKRALPRGDWTTTDMPRLFGISNVPAYVLIDPQGRVAAHEHTPDAIAAKLKEMIKP